MFYAITALFNLMLFCVCSSPFFFPFTGATFNFAIVIWAGEFFSPSTPTFPLSETNAD